MAGCSIQAKCHICIAARVIKKYPIKDGRIGANGFYFIFFRWSVDGARDTRGGDPCFSHISDPFSFFHSNIQFFLYLSLSHFLNNLLNTSACTGHSQIMNFVDDLFSLISSEMSRFTQKMGEKKEYHFLISQHVISFCDLCEWSNPTY